MRVGLSLTTNTSCIEAQKLLTEATHLLSAELVISASAQAVAATLQAERTTIHHDHSPTPLCIRLYIQMCPHVEVLMGRAAF